MYFCRLLSVFPYINSIRVIRKVSLHAKILFDDAEVCSHVHDLIRRLDGLVDFIIMGEG